VDEAMKGHVRLFIKQLRVPSIPFARFLKAERKNRNDTLKKERKKEQLLIRKKEQLLIKGGFPWSMN